MITIHLQRSEDLIAIHRISRTILHLELHDRFIFTEITVFPSQEVMQRLDPLVALCLFLMSPRYHQAVPQIVWYSLMPLPRVFLVSARARRTINLAYLMPLVSAPRLRELSLYLPHLQPTSIRHHGQSRLRMVSMAQQRDYDCLVTMSVAASWQSNSVGHRQISVMRKNGAVYTTVGSVSTMAVYGETTTQEVKFFGNLVSATDALTVQVYQNSSVSLDVSITVSVVRYETQEV